MTTLLHARPTLNVCVETFSERARRRQDLAWMLRVPGWNVDGGALWHDPWLVVPRIVWPEARADRSGHPVQHDVRKQYVACKMPVDVSVAVAPGAKFLDDPRCQADRRIGQRVGQGLRFCSHDPGISRFLAEPPVKLAAKALFVACSRSSW